MDQTRWKLVEQLYEEVRELSEVDRSAYLKKQHKADEDLVAMVHALFARQDEAVDFFSSLQDDIFRNSEIFYRKKDAGAEKPADDSAIHLQDPLIGQQVAQYQIEALLGSGGMGRVYRAHDTKLHRDVALKVINADLNSNDEARERFLVEARAASALMHSNVATVYAIEEILGSRLAIAMSYCEGDTLKEVLKKGALKKEVFPVEKAIQIALQIARGLNAAHRKGIIHRDVKPGNVMISHDGMVRIVDFGLARFSGQSRITRTGSTMGTVSYMAPEQVKGERVTHQVDIWAFGVVLFEMLTGQVPFNGEHMHSMLYAIVNEYPVRLSGLRPDIPAQLDVIVSRALDKDLNRRYKDFEDIISDLESVLAGKELAQPEPVQIVSAVELSDDSAPEPHGPIQILIVDDEPDIELLMRQQYMKKIRAGEWNLIFAENGRDALEKLESNPEIQVVLTDIQMPVMNGLTLLGNIQDMDRLIKTIVVSAYGDMQNIRQAMNNGAYDFVTKPIQFTDLERTIYKTLDNIKEIQAARSAQMRLITLENELGLARKIQQEVLPKKWQENDEVDAFAYMEPAYEMCGDFYDYFFLDDAHMGFFMGDVASQGFTASIIMAMARTLLNADARRGCSPAACMSALNKFLHLEPHEEVFLSAFYGVMNIRNGELKYCNAGHSSPFVMRESGEVEQAHWAGGIGIGIKKDFTYQDSTLRLGPADGLFLYTDGLLKSKNSNRELFSEQQLIALLKSQCSASPSQLIRRIVRELADFGMGAEQTDDRTMMAIRRTMPR